MKQRMFTCVVTGLVVMAGDAVTQTLTNPDISAIADMRYVTRNDVGRALAGSSQTSFEFEELELAIAGYLNPYARADLFLSTGIEGPVEIEEVYATLLRGLPVKAKFGKYKLDMGKLNTQHPHQWGWMETPLMLQSFFGGEGAAATAISVSRLQPIGDTAATLSINAFTADFFGGEEEPDSAAAGSESPPEVGYSGHLSVFRSLTDYTHLEIGASYLFATYDPTSNLQSGVGGVDVKLKWQPDQYRRFTIIGEAMMSEREVADSVLAVSTVTAAGAFTAAELRFRRRFDVGGYYDWAQDAMNDNMATTAVGGYIGFMPVEETIRFSLVYRNETSDFYDGSNNTITFQVLWSAGPHKAHQF